MDDAGSFSCYVWEKLEQQLTKDRFYTLISLQNYKIQNYKVAKLNLKQVTIILDNNLFSSKPCSVFPGTKTAPII